jgi:glycosyltransferase involved in cell wall biosynthesis
MKVLFDANLPFALTHGGAQIQIEQTKKGLEEAGVEVEWLRWWDGEQKADVMHFFYRPHPAILRMAAKKGVKTVFCELLTGLGSRSAGSRWAQKVLVEISKRGLPSAFIERLCWDAYQIADGCIANTSWEKKLMVDMFSARPDRVHVVPNGVEDVFFRDPKFKIQISKSEYLVCTATITERKRVVELAEAATMAQVPIWIIGEPYSKEDPYFLKFLSVIKNSKGVVKYEGGVSERAKMAKIYQRATGFVLLSAMETRSLAAEEAAAGGCPLLLAELPWARASFGTRATYSPLVSREGEARKLKEFYSGIEKVPRPPVPCRWGDVGKQLYRIYEGLLADKTSR